MRPRLPPFLVAAVAVVGVVLAGCTAPPQHVGEGADDGSGTEDGGRVARSGARRGGDPGGEEDNRTQAVLGQASGGSTQPGTYAIHLEVPPGGAMAVEWSIEVEVVAVPIVLEDSMDGDGCHAQGWHSSLTASGTEGSCDPLEPGSYDWTFTLNEPVLSYQAQVKGTVWGQAPPSASSASWASSAWPSDATEA